MMSFRFAFVIVLAAFPRTALAELCGTFYKHNGYAGNAYTIESGRTVHFTPPGQPLPPNNPSGLYVGSGWHRKISSVKIHYGCEMTLYSYDGYRIAFPPGGWQSLSEDRWNDRASAVSCICHNPPPPRPPQPRPPRPAGTPIDNPGEGEIGD
jgi:hypothetical protein